MLTFTSVTTTKEPAVETREPHANAWGYLVAPTGIDPVT